MIGAPNTGNSKWQINFGETISNIKNLKYLGEKSQKEVNRILSKSHILVNTSKEEGFSNTFIQAWMRQVPVISLNCDPDDVLKKENLGFHSGTLKRLINDIRFLVENDDYRQKIGKRAMIYAKNNHSMKNAKKIIEIFDNLLK
jgi:glycosyltransferase involved in cell wall biosynthesis